MEGEQEDGYESQKKLHLGAQGSRMSAEEFARARNRNRADIFLQCAQGRQNINQVRLGLGAPANPIPYVTSPLPGWEQLSVFQPVGNTLAATGMSMDLTDDQKSVEIERGKKAVVAALGKKLDAIRAEAFAHLVRTRGPAESHVSGFNAFLAQIPRMVRDWKPIIVPNSDARSADVATVVHIFKFTDASWTLSCTPSPIQSSFSGSASSCSSSSSTTNPGDAEVDQKRGGRKGAKGKTSDMSSANAEHLSPTLSLIEAMERRVPMYCEILVDILHCVYQKPHSFDTLCFPLPPNCKTAEDVAKLPPPKNTLDYWYRAACSASASAKESVAAAKTKDGKDDNDDKHPKMQVQVPKGWHLLTAPQNTVAYWHAMASRPASSHNGKQALPDGWHLWPCTLRMYPRVAHSAVIAMTGSWADAGAMGQAPPEQVARSDRVSAHGMFWTGSSARYVPYHETLLHNHILPLAPTALLAAQHAQHQAHAFTYMPLALRAAKVQYDKRAAWRQNRVLGMAGTVNHLSASTALAGVETPSTLEPYRVRLRKAREGYIAHSKQVHRLEIRATHPLMRHMSTQTMRMWLQRNARSDKPHSIRAYVKLQYLKENIEFTTLFMAVGGTLRELPALLKRVLGVHWYGEIFEDMAQQLVLAHSPLVPDETAALLRLAEQAGKTGVDWDLERRLQYARLSLLVIDVLPQFGRARSSMFGRAFYLATLLAELFLRSVGFTFYTQKEDFDQQRWSGESVVFPQLTRQILQQCQNNTTSQLRKHVELYRRSAAALVAETALLSSAFSGEAETNGRRGRLQYTKTLGLSNASRVGPPCMLERAGLPAARMIGAKVSSTITRGTWSLGPSYNSGSARQNVTQQAHLENPFAIFNWQTNTTQASASQRRAQVARQVGTRQLGRICCTKTQEGADAGLTRPLALCASVSLSSPTQYVEVLLVDHLRARSCIFPLSPTVAPSVPALVTATATATATTLNTAWSRQVARELEEGAKGPDGKNSETYIAIEACVRWTTTRPDLAVQIVRDARRAGLLHPHVAVHWDQFSRTIHIRTSPGRSVRPLLVLAPICTALCSGGLNVTDLRSGGAGFGVGEVVQRGWLEYVDAQEEATLVVALSVADLRDRPMEPFTHMELDGTTIFSAITASLPTQTTAAPRAVIGSVMGWQSAFAAPNPFSPLAPKYSLAYPQRPLSDTSLFTKMGVANECAHGNHLRVAFMGKGLTTEDGQEHALANHSLGVLLKAQKHTYTLKIAAVSKRPKAMAQFSMPSVIQDDGDDREAHEEWRGTGVDGVRTGRLSLLAEKGRLERIEKPPLSCWNRQSANYDTVDNSGLPRVNSVLRPGDVVIGATWRSVQGLLDAVEWTEMPLDQLALKQQAILAGGGGGKAARVHDMSVVVKDHTCTVTSVQMVVADDLSSVTITVEVSIHQPVQKGDKFRVEVIGQKGVAVELTPVQYLIYSVANGLRPNMCFSSIGVFARGTMGLLTEAHRNQAAAIVGKRLDVTAFRSEAEREEEIDAIAVLLSMGMQGGGYERHMDARTGRLIARPIFVGYVNVAVMTQRVETKENARNRGPVVAQTGQPQDGRARDGGMRFGRMEIDSTSGLGLSFFQQNRMLTASDGTRVAVCRYCGEMAEACEEPGRETRYCRVCMTGKYVTVVAMPQSNRLMKQSFAAIGMRMRIGPEPSLAEAQAARDKDEDGDLAMEPICELGNVPALPEPPRRPSVRLKHAQASELLLFPTPEPHDFDAVHVRQPKTYRQFKDSLQTVQPQPIVMDLAKRK